MNNNTIEADIEYEGECDKTCQQIIGIVFVLVGEVEMILFINFQVFGWLVVCLQRESVKQT